MRARLSTRHWPLLIHSGSQYNLQATTYPGKGKTDPISLVRCGANHTAKDGDLLQTILWKYFNKISFVLMKYCMTFNAFMLSHVIIMLPAWNAFSLPIILANAYWYLQTQSILGSTGSFLDPPIRDVLSSVHSHYRIHTSHGTSNTNAVTDKHVSHSHYIAIPLSILRTW